MGYCIELRNSLFKIKFENKNNALNAIKDLANKGRNISGENFIDQNFYRWVSTSKFLNASLC